MPMPRLDPWSQTGVRLQKKKKTPDANEVSSRSQFSLCKQGQVRLNIDRYKGVNGYKNVNGYKVQGSLALLGTRGW